MSNAPRIDEIEARVQALDPLEGIVDVSDELTATSGVPGAGEFWSTVVGRAPIKNFAALRPSLGIERIITQKITGPIPGEIGPNGEVVYGTVNDKWGQIRFVGKWASPTFNGGTMFISDIENDFVEITFWGTGLNVLFRAGTTRDARYQLDGGPESSNIFPNGSTVISNRNYAENMPVSVVSGQTQGWHTVKIRNGSVTDVDLGIGGFEILNEEASGNITIPAGRALLEGKELELASDTTIPYNSDFDSIIRDGGAVGSISDKGGHVVVYIKADGTIGKSIIETDSGLPLYTTSADHTNEEVITTHHFREFGAGRTDDLSLLTDSGATSQPAAFTLDDGVTSVCGREVWAYKGGLYSGSGSSDLITIVFVGTGLDLELVASNDHRNTVVNIDGVSAGTLTDLSNQKHILKVCSGLPYGTHVVHLTEASSGTQQYSRLIVYGPKKPELPTGAVELSDYFLVADFVPPTGGLVKPAVTGDGLISKTNFREAVYSGTGLTASLDTNTVANWIHGTQVNIPTTSGNFVEYTFFGTGFIFGSSSSGSPDAILSIDGVNYTGAATVVGGTGSWTPGSSKWFVNASRLIVTGLTLGIHTVRLTTDGSGISLAFAHFDTITPIHSPKLNGPHALQSTIRTGSEGILDTRSFGSQVIIPSNTYRAKNIAAFSQTSSATRIPVTDMLITVESSGKPIAVIFDIEGRNNGANNNAYHIHVDGEEVKTIEIDFAGAENKSITIPVVLNLSEGIHTIQLMYNTDGGATTIYTCYIEAYELGSK